MSQDDAEQPISVLLVEDNPDDQLAVRRVLKRAYGDQVRLTMVSDYVDAVEALGQAFDVCLMDYELTGYTALQLLERTDFDALTGPVVLLTGHDGAALDQAALDLGVADFLPKSALQERTLERTIRYCRRQFADQRRLKYLAQHDVLTGLLNRHSFLARLNDWLDSKTHNVDGIYLLYVDLDGFKAINDAWGHDIGDLALKHAAQCLRGAVRQSDLVGRYGGDELIAAVAHVGRDGAGAVVEKVLHSLRQPLEVENSRIVVTASIGVARASQAPGSPDELVRLADHAMLAAKQAGRDTWLRYSTDLPLASVDRAALDGDLRDALGTEQLFLTFESHVDLGSGDIIGAEGLARWNHPQHGAIPPSKFVPMALEFGLTRPFTLWGIEAALRALAAWQTTAQLAERFRLSVNVPPAILLAPGFPEQLAALMDQHGVNGRHLRLEVTENALIAERGDIQVCLNALKAMGISLALDDFGTGHSSLAQIARLPIDTLKIDVEFVARMADDPRSAALVRAVLSLGRELGLTVIAEGVEDDTRLAALREAGCEAGQGFLFPMGGQDEFQALLESGATVSDDA